MQNNLPSIEEENFENIIRKQTHPQKELFMDQRPLGVFKPVKQFKSQTDLQSAHKELIESPTTP